MRWRRRAESWSVKEPLVGGIRCKYSRSDPGDRVLSSSCKLRGRLRRLLAHGRTQFDGQHRNGF